MIREAANRGASVVVLPEMFNCPYDSKFFPGYAESFPDGETLQMLSETAADCGVYLFGGSIPEKDGGQIFNSCFVFGPDGKFLARHRKLHLFDVELSEGISFKESDALGQGDSLTLVETPFAKIGVGICYDIRFPEVARALTLRGAELMVLPAAFNMVTGPAHWELSMRMRAIDNQFYMAAAAPARNDSASYVAYGHSMVVDPWGRIIQSLEEKEGVVVAEIENQRLEQVRREFPLLKHRRTDLYDIKEF